MLTYSLYDHVRDKGGCTPSLAKKCTKERKSLIGDDDMTWSPCPGLPLEPYVRLSYPINALFYVESVKVSPCILGHTAAGGNTVYIYMYMCVCDHTRSQPGERQRGRGG